nr:hypothetical protein [Tanacetum cinerariifolium]
MEKVLLVEAQGNGKVLTEEELEFLADPGIGKGLVTQSVITHNAAYQGHDLDAYDFDCDEISTAKAVLLANLSSYGSYVRCEVPNSANTHNDMIRPMLYDSNVIAKETNMISIADSKETLKIEEDNFGKCFVPQREQADEQALHPIIDQSASSPIKIEAPQELPKVELQAKDMTIKKLKAHIKRIFETSTSKSVKKDFDEIETINIELEHRVTRLIPKNEHLK